MLYKVYELAEWYASFHTTEELEILITKDPEMGLDKWNWKQVITLAHSFKMIEEEIDSKDRS